MGVCRNTSHCNLAMQLEKSFKPGLRLSIWMVKEKGGTQLTNLC